MLLLDRHTFRAGKSYVFPQFSLTLLGAGADLQVRYPAKAPYISVAIDTVRGTTVEEMSVSFSTSLWQSAIIGSVNHLDLCSHYISWGYHLDWD
jgi:hypothetical protein